MLDVFSRVFVTKERLMQYAALPYRRRGGALEIGLVTSRGRGRWILPKGWPEPGLEPHAVAAKEAYEEAGVEGETSRKPIGAHNYRKRLHVLASTTCRIVVFPLHVKVEHDAWPESRERKRRWFSPSAAAQAVNDPDLARLIREFASSR